MYHLVHVSRGANLLSDSFTPSDEIAAENGGKKKKKKKGKIIQTEELAGGEARQATDDCKNDELNNFKVDGMEEKTVHSDQDLLASDEPKEKLSFDK